jgi:hypothetical protein
MNRRWFIHLAGSAATAAGVTLAACTSTTHRVDTPERGEVRALRARRTALRPVQAAGWRMNGARGRSSDVQEPVGPATRRLLTGHEA